MINWKQQIPRWYWIIYWTVPLFGLLVWYLGFFHEYHYVRAWFMALQMVVIAGLMYQRPDGGFWVALLFVVMAVVFLVSCAATEPRRACSNWTNLTWTGGRIIGPRSSYTPISTCAPGGVEGEGSSITWSPSEFEAGLEKDSYPPKP
jgi:hypothetical protein